MEQRYCVDRTPVSEAQAFTTDALDERELDAAATKLLTKPIEAVAALHSGSGSDALVISLAHEFWKAYAAFRKAGLDLDAGHGTEEEWQSLLDRSMDLARQIADANVSTIEGAAYKCLVLGASEADDLTARDDPASDNLWQKIGRQFERMTLAGIPAGFVAPTTAIIDPIFAALEEGRRLLAISEALHARPQAATAEGETSAEKERTAALRALWDHVNGTILETVPLTANGCRELSRFAVDYFDKNGCAISDDEQAVTGLIARSPLMDLGAKQAQPFASVAPGLNDGQSASSPADLANACDWAIKHSAWLNTANIAEGWRDERLYAEIDKYNFVWNRAITEPANTIPALAAKARLFKTNWLEHNGDAEHDSLDKMLLSVMRDVAELERSRPPLVDRLLDGWSEWSKTDNVGASQKIWERAGRIRDRLLYEAAALPATRENAAAKGIAGAWLEYVAIWERGKPRDSYGIDGRLCFDIHDAVTLAAVA